MKGLELLGAGAGVSFALFRARTQGVYAQSRPRRQRTMKTPPHAGTGEADPVSEVIVNYESNQFRQTSLAPILEGSRHERVSQG